MPYTTIASATPISVAWANSNVRDQVVSQFASTAARDAAITSPVNGMVCVTTDTNSVWLRTSGGWTKIGGGGDVRTALFYPAGFYRLNLAASVLNIGSKTEIMNINTVPAARSGDFAIVTANVRVQNASSLGQAVVSFEPYITSKVADAQRLISTTSLPAGGDQMLSGTWLYTFTGTAAVSFTFDVTTTSGQCTIVAPDTWMTVTVYRAS